MKKHVQLLVVLLISISATISLFVFLNRGYEKQTLIFQAVKWIEGKVPDEYIEAFTLPLENEIISLIKNSATSGPIVISKSSPIKPWADEIIEDSPFNCVDIKTAENEYYHIDFHVISPQHFS